MKISLIPAAVLLVATGHPAQAFDCTQATTETEKLICSDDGLKAADDLLGDFWAKLKDAMPGDAFKVLLKEQRAWLKQRDGECATGSDAERVQCMIQVTGDRTAELAARPLSGPGPGSALTAYSIVKPAATARHTRVELAGVRFANPQTAGEIAFNDVVDEITQEAAAVDVVDFDPPGELNVTQEMIIMYAAPHLLSVLVSTGGYSGGAHPFLTTRTINVNADEGLLTFDNLFPANALPSLAGICYGTLASGGKILSKQEKPKRLFTPGVEGIKESVGNLDFWTFDQRGAIVHFPPYAIGPWAAGTFECRIPDDSLRKVAKSPDMLAK